VILVGFKQVTRSFL